MRITTRGAALLAIAVTCYGLGEWLGSVLLRAVAGAAMAAFAVACLLTLRRPVVTATRSIHPPEVRRGASAKGRLVIRNSTGQSSPGFVAQEPVSGAAPVLTWVHPLTSGETVHFMYDLPTTRRGRTSVGPLRLRCEDPLGLVRRESVNGSPGEYWVLPRSHHLDLLPLGRKPAHSMAAALPQFMRGSVDFRTLRPYVAGDELRHVHWPSSARVNTLMVKQFSDPPLPELTILLDDRAQVLTDAGFEEAVEVAASVVDAASRGQHRVRLRTASGLDSGGATVGAIGRILCEIGQVQGDQTWLQGRLPAPLVVISGGAAVAELGAALPRGGGPCIVVDLRPATDVTELAEVTVIRATGAAEAAQGWNGLVRL